MLQKQALSLFMSQVEGGSYHYFGRASFEERSVIVAKSVPPAAWASFAMLKSIRKSALAEKNVGELIGWGVRRDCLFDVQTSDPLRAVRDIHDAFLLFVERAKFKPALIDITAFRREELLFLVNMLHLVDAICVSEWRVVYAGAGEMGCWLSGKVTSVRSVLGFPGDIWPSKKTRLVILMGFEFDRARSIVDAYEPATVLIGVGRKTDAISDDLYKRNVDMVERLKQEIGSEVVNVFEISSKDPTQVVRDLEVSLVCDEDVNTIIAPLHTKMATIGSGLYGIKHPEVQICYSVVEEYNEEEYSTLGSSIYIIPVSELF